MRLLSSLCLVLLLGILFGGCPALADPLAGVFDTYKPRDTLYARANSFRSRFDIAALNYDSLPICKPTDMRMNAERASENLGEILLGNRNLPTNFKFDFLEDVKCTLLCSETYSRANLEQAAMLVRNQFNVHLSLDRLPLISSTSNGESHFGYPFGSILENGHLQVNNFLHFTVMYSEVGGGGYRVDGFSVVPESTGVIADCRTENQPKFSSPVLFPIDTTVATGVGALDFYYSVSWKKTESAVVTTRFDVMQRVNGLRRVHIVTAFCNLAMMLLLGTVVAAMIARTIRRDWLAHSRAEPVEGEEQAGWNLVRGDVFRPPNHPIAFAAMISSGCQVIFLFVFFFLASGISLLHPSQRGSVHACFMALFFASSLLNGYVAGLILKYCNQQSWKHGVAAVSTMPLSLTLFYAILGSIHWWKHSTQAIPLRVLLLFTVMLGVSLPVGLIMGFRAAVITVPARITTIPRLIPVKRRAMFWMPFIFGGFVTFLSSRLEMSSILTMMWGGAPLYVLGYMFAAFTVFTVVCSEVSIIITFWTLNREDYRWWWRSFFSLASSGMYLYLYSIWYMCRYLEVQLFSSIILYLVYMLVVSAAWALGTGTVGFLSSALFVHRIYSASKEH